ncbi:hypothetical protein UPYG_G00194780 [Umbra pygmaea]|uniref:Ribosome biogenesis protein NOP53 n=1 Tax=Umbra pygmaea TaxID=75934 RepID=A0ABD0WGW3_UMBPY
MASVKRHKRVAASQPGYISLKASGSSDNLKSGKRKRVNKNKKKNWNKYSDIQDVEEFLEDVRLQERAIGGLISKRTDESLFFVDTGEKKSVQPVPDIQKVKKSKSHPLKIDLILENDSLIPSPTDVLAQQLRNAKKLRQIAARADIREKKRFLNRRPVIKTPSKSKTDVPDRPYYNLWGEVAEDTADPYYLEQTKKKRVKRPEKLSAMPSIIPAVEIIAPGGSYNPDFFAHQALLLEAHEVEVKREKDELKVNRQLAVKREDMATEETVFKEQVQGLMEEDEEEEEEDDDDEVSARGSLQQEKKTEKERRKVRANKIKEQQKQASKELTGRKQQLFQLRSIQAALKRQEQRTSERRSQRKAKQEAERSMPRRLGKLRFQAQDLEVQLSNEIPGSLRKLKPEGSVLTDRFKSMQKRNLIEPRNRAKFKRKLKVKYVEKRSFREIT